MTGGMYGPVNDWSTERDRIIDLASRDTPGRPRLRVAVEAFVKRFPRFELAGDVRWSVGQIRGPREFPLRVLAAA